MHAAMDLSMQRMQRRKHRYALTFAEAEALQQRAERRQSEPAAAVAAYEAAVVRHWLSTWRNAQIADVLMTSIASNTENRALWLTARHQIKPFSLLWAGKVRAGCPSI